MELPNTRATYTALNSNRRIIPKDRSILPPTAISQFPSVTAVTPSSSSERSGLTVGTLVLKVGNSPWFNTEGEIGTPQ